MLSALDHLIDLRAAAVAATATVLTSAYVRSYLYSTRFRDDDYTYAPTPRGGGLANRLLLFHLPYIAKGEALAPLLQFACEATQIRVDEGLGAIVTNVVTAATVHDNRLSAPHHVGALRTPRGFLRSLRYSVFLGGARILPCDPRDLEYILLGKGAANYAKGFMYEALGRVLGSKSILVLRDDHEHSFHRRGINPAFNARTLTHIANTIVRRHIDALFNTLDAQTDQQQQQQQQPSLNGTAPPLTASAVESSSSSSSSSWVPITQLDALFDTITLNVVSEAAFRQLNIAGTDVADEFRKVQAPTLFPPFLALVPGLRWMLELTVPRESLRKIRNAAETIIAERRRLMRSRDESAHAAAGKDQDSVGRPAAAPSAFVVSEEQQRPLLVDYLILASTDHGVGKTLDDDDEGKQNATSPETPRSLHTFPVDQATLDQAIIDNTVTFLFAGHETTSKTLLFLFLLLSAHPFVQQQLLEELSSAFPLTTIPSLETVHGLPFLNAVVREALRLYGPAGVVFRFAKEDDVLPSGGVVRAGEVVNINLNGMHRHPTIWGEDAHVFRPARWLETPEERSEQAVLRASPCAFMPFLHGPRHCVGKEFAMNELLLITACLVRCFEWGRPAVTTEPPQLSNKTKAEVVKEDAVPPIRVAVTIQPSRIPPVVFRRRME